MSGKRLLDVVALINASRGVLQKHIALRAGQVEAYNKTSTLPKAVRSQTDRVTETAKAASFLASRLNEGRPSWSVDNSKRSATSNSEVEIPSKESTEASDNLSKPKEGLDHDHFYEKSQANSALDGPPAKDLEIKQEQADRYSLPDGTIPPTDSEVGIQSVDHETNSKGAQALPAKQPLGNDGLEPASSGTSSIPVPASTPLSSDAAKTLQRQYGQQIPSKTADALGNTESDPLEAGNGEDSSYRTSGHTPPAPSSLPRIKILKQPAGTQREHQHFPQGQINSDTFYSVGRHQGVEDIPSVQAIPEQDQISEGIDTALFHSPRIAKLLGGKPQRANVGDLKLQGARSTPLENTKLAAGKDQDTVNVHSSSQEVPTIPDISVQEQKETLPGRGAESSVEKLDQEITKQQSLKPTDVHLEAKAASVPYELRESKVPSSRLGRLWNYGGLAAGMFGGAITESLRRVSGSGGEGSFMLSAGNIDRLVSKLSRMRGAALKLGQMMSFQDSKMLPGPIQEVLQRVQDRADYMPPSQRNKVLASNLGPDWRELFSEFEEKPLAAASIGQVHRAVLRSNGTRVAVKVQYPGVAESIDSDLSNLAILLTASRLLPKGLFLEKTIANARAELAWECDYIREAECGSRFKELLADEVDIFTVPQVYREASGKQVLTMEYVDGIGVTRVQNFTREQKDWIGTQILRLCLREITEFRFMQTDPNWTNFLYNRSTKKLELLDFGASREYPQEFITRYAMLLTAASLSDKDTVRDLSIELGYLTGHEGKAMLNAHIASVLTLAEPFLATSPEVYDFKDQTITERVKELIPLMIRERLAPPPEETYSLHRKLSGAFLLCARLGSRVRCRELFENSMRKAEF